MKPKTTETLIAAIDVGANAVRLEIARGFSDGSIESVHQERDPVRPGEGLFQTGIIPPAVVDRLVGVLRRYAIICKRHQARVRAVGTHRGGKMANEKEAFVAEKSLAVVGVSRTRGFGNTLFKHLKHQGYRVFPVNAQAESVEGRSE